MSAVIKRCGNCKYKLLVDEVELISRIDGANPKSVSGIRRC